MARPLISPEVILPTRMTLTIPPDTPLRFSVLEFPYAQAIDTFMERLKQIYAHKHNEPLPYRLYLPYRQLNDALLALAPGIIQAFENGNGDSRRRMVTFTRFEDGTPEDFPSLGQLKILIRHWLDRWSEQQEIQSILQSEGEAAWLALLKADPETEWQHNIHPASLAADVSYANGLAYVALPALLTALLHNRTMIIQSQKHEYPITWRRVCGGGKDNIYLVSQPIPYKDDYFAYRLDFSVQTQAGYLDNNNKPGVWIFAYLSIQRYIAEKYRKGDKGRAISVLVGCNHDRFVGGWYQDTTLIRLGIKPTEKSVQWASGVGEFLDGYSMRKLVAPEKIFATPKTYGNYKLLDDFAEDEYYIVYAEGRKFGDEHERGHQIKTGISLRERSQIMERVLSALGDWLHLSPHLQKDVQDPQNTLALRDYKHMVRPRKNHTVEHAAWRTALTTALKSSQHSHLHLMVLYRDPKFCSWVEAQLDQALMGANRGENPLATVTFEQLPVSLYAPLDPGELDPQHQFLPSNQKPAGFARDWKKQMQDSYFKKRDEWRDFLKTLPWKPNARRLVLIDSTGEPNMPDDQKIKGAVRDACHRENVLSQFIVGDKLKSDKGEKAHRLNTASASKLQSAVLDLLVRQQGILYAPPHEIYERAAGLDAELARALDIIAFCRVQRTSPSLLNYVLAVCLRADGEVNVALPHMPSDWLPYDTAAHTIGILFSDHRASFTNNRVKSPLRLKHEDMLNFVHTVLTQSLERPTIAVIEAEGWRNGRGQDEEKHCWTQLRNRDLFQYRDVLRFDPHRVYQRSAPALNPLLAVVRLRMNDETPQYITANEWAAEEDMRDIPHLTGYVDTAVTDPLHYMSVAGLPETQKKQRDKDVREGFKGDIKASKYDEIAFKHPQLIELVPFFVHAQFQDEAEQRKLCRCVQFLRVSPAFSMSHIALPYPMHLGEKLIEDQLVTLGIDD